MPLSSQQIIARFNRAATTYDSVSALQRQMADEIVERLESQPAKFDASIADLGCGTGYLLQQLQQRGYNHLHGFDLADCMLKIARDRIPTANVQLTQADLQAIPMPAGHFDFLFSNAAIQWCQTDRAAAEIARLLRPQGRAFISTFGPQTLKQWRSVFEAHGHARVHRFESYPEVKEKFEQFGLALKQVQTRSISQSFQSVRSMFNSIKELGASNATVDSAPISKSVYRSIMDQFQQQLSANGELNLTFETISFEAVHRSNHTIGQP